MSDQSVAETSTSQHTTLTTDIIPCFPVRFDPTISASDRSQTYALDRAATGTGKSLDNTISFKKSLALVILSRKFAKILLLCIIYVHPRLTSIPHFLFTGIFHSWCNAEESL